MKRIAIIGGGVAGLSAAIYALRANTEVTLFEQYGLGGLVATIDKIENYPSYKTVEGWRLAQDMSAQAKDLGLKVIRQKVVSLIRQDNEFVIKTDKDEYTFASVVVATGTSHNKLGVEGDYVGKGVSYCATCDGNFYKGRPVAVVGAGGAAVREATYLSDLCSVVYAVVPKEKYAADELAVKALTERGNVVTMFGSEVVEINGENSVEGIKVYADGKTQDIAVSGVFVAVGASPVCDFIAIDGLKTDRGYIEVDGRCRTSVEGLFACGDVTNGPLKQIVTACADGAKAGTYASAYSASKGK